MKPIKGRHFIKETSELINLNEDTTRSIINFYYKQLREKLGNLAYNQIFVDGLGKFYLKERALISEEKKYNTMITNAPNIGRTERVLCGMKVHLSSLEQARRFIEEERQRRKDHKLIRKEYDERKNKGDLEK